MENGGFDPREMLATKKQVSTYFGLMLGKGFKPPQAKQMLKDKYGLESFKQIDKTTMGIVIDRLINGKKRA